MEGGTTPKVPCWILSEVVSAGTKTHGQKLKELLGSWHRRVHHRGYEGSFFEAAMPGMQRRLIEVDSTQVGNSPSQAIIRGWEYLPKESDVPKRPRRYSARLGSSGVTCGGPRGIAATLNADSYPLFRVANVAWGGGGGSRH